MKQRALPILKFVLRWTVAVVGVTWVVMNLTIRDRVNVVDPQTLLVTSVPVLQRAEEEDAQFTVADPVTGEPSTVDRERLVRSADREHVRVMLDDRPVQPVQLQGMTLRMRGNDPVVERLLIIDPTSGNGRWIRPSQVDGGFRLSAARPLLETGLASMVRHANPWLLVLSVVVFPVTFIMTSFRWQRLLQALDVNLPTLRVFALNMVGAFYNTFMPGSTGGDVLKAYYVARQTSHKTRGVMSVFIDRVVGLLTLVMMGGLAAVVQYYMLDNRDSPTGQACLHVAVASVVILLLTAATTVVVISSRVRTMLGLNYMLRRMPMQEQLRKVKQVADIYRGRPGLIAWALLITVPVHGTVIVSAMIAGIAFGLPMAWPYYFVVVPVAVLVAAIPISPQGAGVMEAFTVVLTSKQGATVSQALALTMSIRVVQILWNLTGGIFVLRGGFSDPHVSGDDLIAHPEQVGGAPADPEEFATSTDPQGLASPDNA